MRGKRAKQIKKSVYKDISTRIKRKYARGKSGGIVEVGLRGQYQAAKKQYKKARKGGLNE